MAFWGIEIKPGKPASLNLTRRLVVKQAALVVSKASKKTEPCVLSVQVADDDQRYVVCRLHEGVLEQCPMELPFSPGDEATVHLTGAHAVHLTGFLELDDEDDMEDMDEIDELDELDEEPMPAGKKPASGKAAPAANVGKGRAVPEDMKDDESEGEEDDSAEADDFGEEESGEEESGEEESGEESDEVEIPARKRAAPVAAAPPSAKKAKPSTPATAAAPAKATPAKSAAPAKSATPAKSAAPAKSATPAKPAAASTPAAKSEAGSPASGPNTWTEAEDAQLTKAIAKVGPDAAGRWEKVAAMVGSRSKEQCKKRAKAIKA